MNEFNTSETVSQAFELPMVDNNYNHHLAWLAYNESMKDVYRFIQIAFSKITKVFK